MDGLIWFLLSGLAAGWLAGQIMKKRSMGLVGNLVGGVIGAQLGGWLFGVIGL
ncbi:MAG: GlsB/YeaQ/YmgE family stress response membrane protein [bacterium]